MLHHEGISEEMFKRAALSQEQLEDSDIQDKVTELLNQLGKQNTHWNPLVFLEIIRQLTSYSLIDFDQQNEFYNIHPLVQHWSRTMIHIGQPFLERCILSIIGLSISWEFKTVDYQYRWTLFPHTTSCMTSLQSKNIDFLIASNIALIYDEQGQWKEAEALEVVVMEKCKQLLGDEHPDTLTSMANLASTYLNQGKRKEAEAL